MEADNLSDCSIKTEDFVLTKGDFNDLKGHIKWCRTRLAVNSNDTQ